MKRVACLIVGVLFFASASRAETPCDFKGVSVGNKMAAAEIMAAFGVTKYKTNPSFEADMAAVEKYSTIPAMELEEWKIGPYCDDSSCRIPYGVTVGNDNTPVNVFVSFHEGLVSEIDVSFNTLYWDEITPILDQKYGADWKVERDDMAIIDYETKKSEMQERITLTHRTNGTNPRTRDRCQIWATNFDIVFKHHDALGPYHSTLVVKLISKNF